MLSNASSIVILTALGTEAKMTFDSKVVTWCFYLLIYLLIVRLHAMRSKYLEGKIINQPGKVVSMSLTEGSDDSSDNWRNTLRRSLIFSGLLIREKDCANINWSYICAAVRNATAKSLLVVKSCPRGSGKVSATWIFQSYIKTKLRIIKLSISAKLLPENDNDLLTRLLRISAIIFKELQRHCRDVLYLY